MPPTDAAQLAEIRAATAGYREALTGYDEAAAQVDAARLRLATALLTVEGDMTDAEIRQIGAADLAFPSDLLGPARGHGGHVSPGA